MSHITTALGRDVSTKQDNVTVAAIAVVSIHILCAVQAAVICNNAQIVEGTLQGQPTEGALLACAMKV